MRPSPTASDGAVILRSPLLSAAGFAHGFATRLGGVSAAPFDTLNLQSPQANARLADGQPGGRARELNRAGGDLGGLAVDMDERLDLPRQVLQVTARGDRRDQAVLVEAVVLV